MAGEALREFDIDLGEYILGQIRPHLRELPARPKPGGWDRAGQPVWNRHMEWERLEMTAWAGRVVSALPVELVDYVWMGVDGEAVPRRLNDAELAWLAFAFDDPPDRLEGACLWTPFPALHRRAVECIPEISSALTQQTAEEWAADSAGFAARLCEDGLSLVDGIAIVRDWLLCARRLLKVMGAPPSPCSSNSRSTAPGLVTRQAEQRELTDTGRVSTQKVNVTPTETAVCGWREAMAITGLKKTKLYDLFGRGVLRGYRDGKMIRFDRTGLTGYMKERENAPAAAPPRPARRPRKGRPATGMRLKFL